MLALLKRCGLVPLAIDAVPGAATRSLLEQAASDEDHPARVLVDIGHGSTTISVAHRDRVRFVRRLDAGLGNLDDDVAKTLQIDSEQAEALRNALAGGAEDGPTWPPGSVSRDSALAAVQAAAERWGKRMGTELSKCVQYYGVTFRGERPTAGLACGGGGREGALLEVLSRETGIGFRGVEAVSELEWVSLVRELPGNIPPSLMAVSAGLALYGESDLMKRAAA
jgi:Tfp pilus assembly PilM family ATPase